MTDSKTVKPSSLHEKVPGTVGKPLWSYDLMIVIFYDLGEVFDPVIFKFKIWWSMDQKTVISWFWSQKLYDLVVMISQKSWS